MISLQNLSDFINKLWTQFQNAAWNSNEIAGTIVSTFSPSRSAAKPWYQVTGQIGPIVSMITSFIGLIPVAGDAMKIPSFIGGLLGGMGAATTAAFASAPSLTSADNNAGTVISGLQTVYQNSLQNFHKSIFMQGDYYGDILSGGSFADRSRLGLDDDDAVTNAQHALEDFTLSRMINSIWYNNNVFIVYMPYGKVAASTESVNRTFATWNQASCELYQKGNEDRVICDVTSLGLSPGSAVLT